MYFYSQFKEGGRVKVNPNLKPEVSRHYSNFNLLEREEVYIISIVYQYGGIKLVGFEKKVFHSDIFVHA